MRIAVIGGNSLIASKILQKLREGGHEVVMASPDCGVSTLTGEGLGEALKGAAVVVDASGSLSFEDAAAEAFFEMFRTRRLLAAEAAAGLRHHVAVSAVGAEGLAKSGYFRAKIAREELIATSTLPYSIVRATELFESVKSIADAATDGTRVRLAPVLVQPMAADDAASAVARTAVGAPVNGIVEVAGPERFRLDEFIGWGLRAWNDPREVVADPQARYFGATPRVRMIVPGDDARLGETRFEDWLRLQGPAAGGRPASARVGCAHLDDREPRGRSNRAQHPRQEPPPKQPDRRAGRRQ